MYTLYALVKIHNAESNNNRLFTVFIFMICWLKFSATIELLFGQFFAWNTLKEYHQFLTKVDKLVISDFLLAM